LAGCPILFICLSGSKDPENPDWMWMPRMGMGMGLGMGMGMRVEAGKRVAGLLNKASYAGANIGTPCEWMGGLVEALPSACGSRHSVMVIKYAQICQI